MDLLRQPISTPIITGFFYESRSAACFNFKSYRTLFQSLLELLAPEIPSKTVPVEIKLLAAVWMASDGESFRGVADRLGMSKGSLHLIFINVCGKLSEKLPEVVTWPTEGDMRKCATDTQQHYGFPGAAGFIDGCHIPIKGKGESRDSYINRKGFSSVLIQAICQKDLRFVDVLVGWPGSVHDAGVFRNSEVSIKINEMPDDLHILGDSAYPLEVNLMTPFRDNGQLTEEEKRFNILHCSARCCVERTFGLLKGKFRRLKYLDMSLEEDIPRVISACVFLHNYIIVHETDPQLEEDSPRDRDAGVARVADNQHRPGHAATEKRRRLAAAL